MFFVEILSNGTPTKLCCELSETNSLSHPHPPEDDPQKHSPTVSREGLIIGIRMTTSENLLFGDELNDSKRVWSFASHNFIMMNFNQ
jgi:hypothetical protein